MHLNGKSQLRPPHSAACYPVIEADGSCLMVEELEVRLILCPVGTSHRHQKDPLVHSWLTAEFELFKPLD